MDGVQLHNGGGMPCSQPCSQTRPVPYLEGTYCMCTQQPGNVSTDRSAARQLIFQQQPLTTKQYPPQPITPEGGHCVDYTDQFKNKQFLHGIYPIP